MDTVYVVEYGSEHGPAVFAWENDAHDFAATAAAMRDVMTSVAPLPICDREMAREMIAAEREV